MEKFGLSLQSETKKSFPKNPLNNVRLQAENQLRPLSFSDFTGQQYSIERLKIMVGAAKARKDSLNHVLLSGPPGLGKTTLAWILGSELGSNVCITSGPIIEKPGDLAGLLTNLKKRDILFIDEIHRIPKTVEEYLYSAMEDYCIDIMIDQGPKARSIRLNIPQFTLVGATTKTGLLSSPLRSRFTLKTRLGYYHIEDLTRIVLRSCSILNILIDKDASLEIAARARGSPRIANNLIHFTRDYAQQKGQNQIRKDLTIAALELLQIDAQGLDEMDKQILRFIAEHHKGGPVGLSTIAIGVGEEANTIEEAHEPYLIREGYIQRTTQGRILTPKSWEVLKG